MGSNREKCNIAIAILEALPFLMGKKLFHILVVAIIFSPTVMFYHLGDVSIFIGTYGMIYKISCHFLI